MAESGISLLTANLKVSSSKEELAPTDTENAVSDKLVPVVCEKLEQRIVGFNFLLVSHNRQRN